MKKMLKLGLILAAYAVVACVALAFVYLGTADRIEAAKQQAIVAALKEIFPDATNFEAQGSEYFIGEQAVKVSKVYLAQKDDQTIGLIVQASGPTYGSATMLVGINMDRKITTIKFLELTDTPGLGTKAADPSFANQFIGKSVDDSFTAGSDIQAISGATVTSKGVANITKYAAYMGSSYLAEKYGGKPGSGEAPTFASVAAAVGYDVALASLYPNAQYESITGQITNTIDRSMGFGREELIKRDGKVIAVAIEVIGPTYKTGAVVVGVNLDNNLDGLRIIELKDTKNIGTLALEPDFWRQFTGKSINTPMLVGDGFDAITGATITAACIADMARVAGVEGSLFLAQNYGGKMPTITTADVVLNSLSQDDE